MSNFLNEHPFHATWVLFEHEKTNQSNLYGGKYQDLAHFNTVEHFWRVWSFLPKVSEVSRVRGLDAFSIFKKGIYPEWEDEANVKGCQLECQLSPEHIDGYWEDLVIATLGEVLEEDDEICGIRAVDRMKKRGGGYRLEIWMRASCSDEKAERVRLRVREALADGDKDKLETVPQFQFSRRSS